MITIYESERLFKLLRDKNRRNTLNSQNLSFDLNSQKIVVNNSSNIYTGRREAINILPRLESKYINNKAFESHLQAYIIQNIGRGTNTSLDACLLNGLQIEWLGNEVSCGVGMQRIDIAYSLVKNNSRIITAIELKSIVAYPEIIYQIKRYIDWLEQYYVPNRISDIQPMIISKKIHDKEQQHYQNIITEFKSLNNSNQHCLPLKYIEYEFINNTLLFDEIQY